MEEIYSTRWEGYYFDGRSAERQRVTVIVLQDGLYIVKADGSTLRWTYDGIRQTQGFHSGEHIRLEKGEDVEGITETVIITDEAFLKAIRQVVPDLGRRFQSPIHKSRLFKIALITGAGAILMAAFLYLWGIPTLAEIAASVIPVSWEEKLGETYMESLAPPDWRCNNPRRKDALDRVLSTLTAALPESPYTFRLTVVRGDTVNAFAMPGGYIVVYEGLIRKTKTPEELAGVLAHEIQHIEYRHGTKALFRELSMGALFAAVAGDAQGMSYALEAARMLGSLRYGRKDEETADAEGMKMIKKARINPQGMIDIFTTFEKELGDMPKSLQYLSTHPRTGERIKGLKRIAALADYKPIALLPNHSWQDVQKICDGER